MLSFCCVVPRVGCAAPVWGLGSKSGVNVVEDNRCVLPSEFQGEHISDKLSFVFKVHWTVDVFRDGVFHTGVFGSGCGYG